MTARNQEFKVALIGHSDPVVPAWVCAALTEAGIGFAHDQCADARRIIELAHDAHIVWTFGSNPTHTAQTWHEQILGALPQLQQCLVILRAGSGTDNVPVTQATQRGILVVNTPAATAPPVAEYAVTLMLAVMRQVVFDATRVRHGQWSQPAQPTAVSLHGKTVGLIGFGQIAQGVARRLRGFEVGLLAHDPAVSPQVFQQHEVAPVALDDLLAQSDIISIHCPLLDSTRHLISERQLRMVKPTAFLINTARGAIIDEAALIKVLQEGRLAGAALDVLEQEPPPSDHPLLHLENVIITPHIAAYSQDIYHQMWRLSVESVLDVAAGRRPRSCVNSVDIAARSSAMSSMRPGS